MKRARLVVSPGRAALLAAVLVLCAVPAVVMMARSVSPVLPAIVATIAP